MAGPESSEPNKPQTVSKTEDSNVCGTRNSFNVTSDGKIVAKGATINSGCGAGNPKHATDGQKIALKGCSGTNNAFNAASGGRINFSGATVNSGAFAGNGIPLLKVTMHSVTQAAVPKGIGNEPNKPQTASKTEHSNVSGTQDAFNTTGDGAILAKDATINSGYGAGNPRHPTDGQKIALKGCSGTNNAFNAASGGNINLSEATVNSGAFAGNCIPQPKVTMHIVTQAAVPKLIGTVGYEGELDSNRKRHFDDKGKQ